MSSLQRTIGRNIARIENGGAMKRAKKPMGKEQLRIDREKYAQAIAAKKAKKAAKPGILAKIRNALQPNREAAK